MRDRGREPRAQLLVGGEIAFAREVHEALAPASDLVGDDERDHAALAGEQVRWELRALDEAVDRLARTAARKQDAIVVAEHDHGLAALLDERPAPDRVGVGHPHPSNRTLADRLPRAHGVRTHMSVNACVPRKEAQYDDRARRTRRRRRRRAATYGLPSCRPRATSTTNAPMIAAITTMPRSPWL